MMWLLLYAVGAAVLAVGDTDENAAAAEAKAAAWRAVRRASQVEFRGSLLIRHEVSDPEASAGSVSVSYSRVSVGPWGAVRVDHFDGPDEPSSEAKPTRTDVLNPSGYWTEQGGWLWFVRSRHPERWGSFGAGPANVMVARRAVSRHVYQRAVEMERWELFNAELKQDELKASFYGDPNRHNPLYYAEWRRRDGEWLIDSMGKHPRRGSGPVVVTKYADYRRVGRTWIAHRVERHLHIERRSLIDTVVAVGGPAPGGGFRPPLPEDDGRNWKSELQELTASGWIGARISPWDLPDRHVWLVEESRLNALSPGARLPAQFLDNLHSGNEPPVLHDLRLFVRGEDFISFAEEDD